jgi:hypothetical protein
VHPNVNFGVIRVVDDELVNNAETGKDDERDVPYRLQIDLVISIARNARLFRAPGCNVRGVLNCSQPENCSRKLRRAAVKPFCSRNVDMEVLLRRDMHRVQRLIPFLHLHLEKRAQPLRCGQIVRNHGGRELR